MVPGLGTRKALLLVLLFAALVVLLSTVGPGPGALLYTVFPLAASFVVLYFVVGWAVSDEDYGRRRRRLETP